MFRIFRNFRKQDLLLLLGGVIAVVLQVGLELKMPDYMSEITKLVETEGSEMSDIMRNGGLMLACALGSFVANVGACFFFATASASLSMNTRKKLFDQIVLDK